MVGKTHKDGYISTTTGGQPLVNSAPTSKALASSSPGVHVPDLTASFIKAALKKPAKRYADGNNLYLCVQPNGTAYWMLRYSSGGKRREMTLGHYPQLTLAAARALAGRTVMDIKSGIDPLYEKNKQAHASVQTLRELFDDWYTTDLCSRLKHPTIPKRIFDKEIAPALGHRKVHDVTPLDVRAVIRKVAASGRPTIANDTLMYLKQLFRHSIKLGLRSENPAAAFSVGDAGGVEASRERYLSEREIQDAFSVFRKHLDSFGRDNYLACCLFLVLAVRKSELCQAKWHEFDLDNATWHLPKERSKSKTAISIPLPTQAVSWLKALRETSFGSEYVFPARRASSRPHMGPDTLNRAISKLFGQEPGKKVQPPNVMGNVMHFTVHDLRRTFRSLAAASGVPSHVAERCLNHKLKGVEGIYDRYDYFDERKAAHQLIADRLAPYIQPSPT